jgi:hypothetical protein
MFDTIQRELYTIRRNRYLRIARRYYKKAKRGGRLAAKWERKTYDYLDKYKELWAYLREIETGERIQV